MQICDDCGERIDECICECSECGELLDHCRCGIDEVDDDDE